MLKRIKIKLLLLGLLFFIFSCKKNDGNPGGSVIPPVSEFSYGDSVFYLTNQSADYIVPPVQNLTGQFIAFPDGLVIDPKTGAVNVSKSETGLRYRITFIPAGSVDSVYTEIVISGVNFLDGFYKLTTADSVAAPVYNANNSANIPGLNNGSIFDEGANCNAAGCSVDVTDGIINLAQTVRNGVFGATPANNDRQEFQLNYRINDKSGKALNTLKIKLYYFDTMNDVTQEAYDIISSRQGTLLGLTNPLPALPAPVVSTNGIGQTLGGSKPPSPRPPCIFIIAR